jgi:8-oxo-dGTP pyrophosphatase MutT (NUDIX family)
LLVKLKAERQLQSVQGPAVQNVSADEGATVATKILEVTDVNVIRAAGGVVFRESRSGETEVAVIHRPAYDDWTLPKGKIEPDETPEDAALREVREETGLRCELIRPLGCTAYVDRRGRDKVACYWVMEVRGGRFRPGIEVDKLLWLPIDQAVKRLTYGRDKTLLQQQDL